MRILGGLLLLAGVLFWMTGAGEIRAQSKKKMTGPVVTLNGQKSQTFDYWKAAKESKPELYRFTFPVAPSDKIKEPPELVIVPITGSDEGLIDSWKKMFFVAEGKKLDANVKDLKSNGGANIKVLDVYGTYLQKSRPDDPDDKATKRDRFRMLSALVDVKGEKYQVRLLGSSPTVGQILPDYNEWLKNFK